MLFFCIGREACICCNSSTIMLPPTLCCLLEWSSVLALLGYMVSLQGFDSPGHWPMARIC